MKSDKIKPNSMKFNFILLLITIGLPPIHLLGQSNKSIIPIVNDTTIKKQPKNTFSLILEVGKSNIFNSLGTVYRDDYIIFPAYYEKVKDANKISIDGDIAFSIGISINHKLNSLSKKMFKENTKSFILFKNQLLFNDLSFFSRVKQNIPKGSTYLQSDYESEFNNKPIKLQMFEISPSIEIIRNLKGKVNLMFNLGPKLLVLYHQEKVRNLNSPQYNKFGKIGLGGQIAIGIGYNKSSVKIKYQTFSATPDELYSQTNLFIFNDLYPKARFESLNLSTEITF